MVPALLAAALMAESAPSDRAMLESFKAACIRTGDMAAMKADALAAGWEAIADDADPRVERLVRAGREDAGSDSRISGAVFRRSEGGRDYFLVQTRVEAAEGFWGVGCRAYDFAASAPIDPAVIESWMGRKPTGVEQPAPGLSRLLWEPGWRPGVTVEASHVPPGHPLGERFGLQGNILVAQAIGGF